MNKLNLFKIFIDKAIKGYEKNIMKAYRLYPNMAGDQSEAMDYLQDKQYALAERMRKLGEVKKDDSTK